MLVTIKQTTMFAETIDACGTLFKWRCTPTLQKRNERGIVY